MESNNKSKEINIKNGTWYYFDGIMKIEDFNFDKILIFENLYKNILVYDISRLWLVKNHCVFGSIK